MNYACEICGEIGRHLDTCEKAEISLPRNDAVGRALQLMEVPMCDLPAIANEFRKVLCREFGACMETFITAFACYAQCVEKLPCDDDLYTVRPQHVEWFRERGIDCEHLTANA